MWELCYFLHKFYSNLSYLSYQLLLSVAKEHDGEVVVDAVDGPIGKEGDHSTDVGKDPHDTDVHSHTIVFII